MNNTRNRINIRLSTQINRLYDKIKKESIKEKDYILPSEELNLNKKKKDEGNSAQILNNYLNDLRFFKKLLKMIQEGATGFDLAYEVEKNHAIKKLIYDGILFYNNFVEIGNNKFIDIPDEKKIDYKLFKTVEKTEKYIFLLWINKMIKKLEEILSSQDVDKEIIDKQLGQPDLMKTCKKCGYKLKDNDQILCENCGAKIRNINLIS